MKCDELKVYVPQDGPWGLEPEEGGQLVEEETCYLKSEVDAAIDELKTEHHKERHEYIEMVAQLRRENAELKAQVNGFKNRSNLWEYNAQNEHNAAVAVRMENAKLKAKLDKTIAERDGNQVCIDALKQKLENVQASMYADVVDANMENRRIRRALWIARANRAIEKIAWFKLWNASISTMNPEDGARQEFDKWKRNLGKFLKKAEADK